MKCYLPLHACTITIVTLQLTPQGRGWSVQTHRQCPRAENSSTLFWSRLDEHSCGARLALSSHAKRIRDPRVPSPPLARLPRLSSYVGHDAQPRNIYATIPLPFQPSQRRPNEPFRNENCFTTRQRVLHPPPSTPPLPPPLHPLQPLRPTCPPRLGQLPPPAKRTRQIFSHANKRTIA